ncbi:LOW QUALITY PROTEIN: uncharacterized protein Dere_GG18635 [Drosophila erecta]|uniref:Cytochrome b561 domain-containing protein n=1 Tax=Drosophila erecta TaxID=7220 RepID=B3NTY4_DROER|nr:LOW QUALITY PROTEIN: uncharacterized protein Dere_GG18635 [Drosophila erecta]
MSQREIGTTEKLVFYEFAWPLLGAVFGVNLYRIILELLAHILLIVVAVVVAIKASGMDDHRSGQHALYAVLGLFLCMGESLLVCHSWWLGDFISRKRLNLLHMVLGIVGLWLGSVGIFLKSIFKSKTREPHFSSKHGLCGLLGLLLFGGTLASGFALMYFTHLALHSPHRLMGLCGFLLLSFSQWFALNLGFARREWSGQSIKWLKIATLGATISVVGYELLCLCGDIVHLLPNIWFKAMGLKIDGLDN